MSPRPALVLVALGAAACGGGRGGAAAPAGGGVICAESPFAETSPDTVAFWAERPGVYDAEPPSEAGRGDHAEARDASGSLWLGSLRRRGGEVYLLEAGSRTCRILVLEALGEDRGWLVLGTRAEGDGEVQEVLRYSFSSTVTGFLSAEEPSRSRSLEEVSLELAGPFLRRRAAGSTPRTVGASGCAYRLHVVGGDDERLVAVSAPGLGPVRSYAPGAGITLYLDRAGCQASAAAPR